MRPAVAESSLAVPMGTTPITVSLGGATSSGPGWDADGLIRLADKGLYRAKRGAGRVPR
jgi:GGDEF domain-containing protein